MRDFLRRWRWALVVVALLAAGLGYAFWPESKPVDLGRVTRGAMAVGVTDDGVTRARALYVVTAPVAGYLDRIDLEVGDPVQGGAVVARMHGAPSGPLDPRSREEAVAALAVTQATRRQASATLAQARRDLARVEALETRGYFPPADAEARRTRVATATAALAQAQADERRALAVVAGVSGRAGGDAVLVRSPAGGLVLDIMTQSEGALAQGAPLLAVGDPRRIEIVVDLLSRDAVKVRPGDLVEIAEWGGGRPLTGRVTRIEPFGRLKVSALGIEEQRVNVIVALQPADMPEAARLGHGYEVEATIVLWRSDDVLRLPIAALFRGARGDWRVFVADQGRLSERSLRVGHLNEDYAEVLSGLRAGETVVLNPGSALKAGTRVRPRQAAAD